MMDLFLWGSELSLSPSLCSGVPVWYRGYGVGLQVGRPNISSLLGTGVLPWVRSKLGDIGPITLALQRRQG